MLKAIRQLLAASSVALLFACGGGIDGAGMRGGASAAPPGRSQAQTPALTLDALAEWAANTYPDLFKGTPFAGYVAPYHYRYFSDSDTYIGENGGTIYLLGAFTNWNILEAGPLSGFSCAVMPASCEPQGDYFAQVPNAFPDIGPYIESVGGSAIMTNVAAADLNRDGLTDIVIHLWAGYGLDSASLPAGAPTPNRVIALLQTGAGVFEDRTAEVFGRADVDLCGAATRKHRVADLNGDGYADIVYATNREDGRTTEWSAQSCALLSNGNGTYKVVEFGQSIFHHSVDVATSPLGQPHVLLPGAESGYTFDNGTAVFTDLGLPLLGQETILATRSAAVGYTDRILSTRATGEVSTAMLLEYGTTDFKTWSKVAELNFDSARLVKFGMDAATSPDAILYSWRGQEFVGANFFESCNLLARPGEPPLRIVHFTPYWLPGGSGGRAFIPESEVQPYSRLLSLKNVNGALVDTEAVAGSASSENINFIRCGDLNGDGHEDVATYPYRAGAKPIVYLNDRQGKLTRVPEARFPDGPADGRWTSMLVDLNADGVQDLIYFPGNGCSAADAGCRRFALWKGLRAL